MEKNCLFSIIFFVLTIVVFHNKAFAQVNVVFDLKDSNDDTVHLQQVLVTDSAGDNTIEINESEIFQLLPTSGNANGLVLTSADPNKFQVFNNKYVVGINKTDTEIDLTGTIGGIAVNLNGRSKIKVRVIKPQKNDDILSEPTFLSYKVVKDAFGRRIAEYYLVIQVNIQNNNSDKRFLIQDVSVAFDPKQCQAMETYFNKIGSTTTGVLYGSKFKEDDCIDKYVKYFGYPTNISPIERETILAAANTEKYRSKRYMLFNTLKFVADVGGGLTTFKILGRDGISGFAFLGGTIFNSLDSALPKIADEKRTTLENSIPQENVIVNTNEAKKVNIFIPADRVFTNESWNNYKRSVKKKTKAGAPLDPLDFRRYMQLFTIASAKGVLIDSNSKTTDSTGGGATGVIKNIKTKP